MNDKQQAFIDDLAADGWQVRAIQTTPGVVQDEQGADVARDDADGPIRVTLLKVVATGDDGDPPQHLERRYDVGEDGSAHEVPLAATFGPHENPALGR